MGGVPGEAADHHPRQHRPRDAGERLRPRPASQGSLQKNCEFPEGIPQFSTAKALRFAHD